MGDIPRSDNTATGGGARFLAGLVVFGAFARSLCIALVSLPVIMLVLPAQQADQSVAPAPAASPSVPVVILSSHLERSERLLVELKHARADDVELASPLRDEARSLLPANTRARQDATQSADPKLKTALDHLDRLLTTLANQPGELNAAAIARLQDEISRDGLLLEVRMLLSRFRSPAPGVNRGEQLRRLFPAGTTASRKIRC